MLNMRHDGDSTSEMKMNTLRAISLVGVLGVAGCAGTAAPSATVTTANPAWEHYFDIAYDVQQQGSARTLSGYVTNEDGSPVQALSLLVQGLDAGENVVTQRLVWIHGGVPGFGRSYFTIAGLEPAEKYRVTVWSFDRRRAGG